MLWILILIIILICFVCFRVIILIDFPNNSNAFPWLIASSSNVLISRLICRSIISVIQISETLIIVCIAILLRILIYLNIVAMNTFEGHMCLSNCKPSSIWSRSWHALLLTILLRVLISLHQHLVVVTILILLTRFLWRIWILTFFTLRGRTNSFTALQSAFTWLIILKRILT